MSTPAFQDLLKEERAGFSMLLEALCELGATAVSWDGEGRMEGLQMLVGTDGGRAGINRGGQERGFCSNLGKRGMWLRSG